MHQYVTSPRRYYLLKRQWAAANGERTIELAWQAKQEAEAGSDLPASFPFRARLADAFYTTSEDLDGATVDELSELGAFTVAEATAILSAFNNLGS